MTTEKICCPKFNPEKWDQKTFNWSNKLFIKESMPTFFHIPFFPIIGKKITKMCQLMEVAQKVEADKEDMLMLFHDPSAFKSEIYLSVTGPVSEANNVNISGNFIAKVFTGSYNAVPKFMKQMDEYLVSQGKKAKDYYIHYAYCPKCAKKYGDNFMIIFAQI
jgi:hypothetical protein